MPMHPWLRGATALTGRLFGGSCYLCHGASKHGILCAACAAELPRLRAPRCPRCALPSAAGALCGRCLGDPPAYDATVAVFAYEFAADVLVQGLKFRSELSLASLLAAELAAEIGVARDSSGGVDLVVPVPLHARRFRERGYNQSMEIAREIAARLQVPLTGHVCERVRDTPAQIDLAWKERRRNVRGAFSCRRALDGLRIAVVDDVMTTGATLGELAATLKQFGAARVMNWVVARTTFD